MKPEPTKLQRNLTSPQKFTPGAKLMRLNAVLEYCGFARSTLFRLIERSGFPNGHNMSGARILYWRLDEIDQWIDEQTGAA